MLAVDAAAHLQLLLELILHLLPIVDHACQVRLHCLQVPLPQDPDIMLADLLVELRDPLLPVPDLLEDLHLVSLPGLYIGGILHITK